MEQSGREYERAITYIQSLISSHRIEIGDKLPSEREISQELCLSRNSTREALRMLENMGVLESRQGSGNYLCGYMTQSFKNAFDMMILLQETNREDICRFRRSMEKAVYDLAYQRRMDSPYIQKMEEVLQSFPDAELERQVKLDKAASKNSVFFHFVTE
jgi:GntR family transcriptional repressor for pyruvate dehydrogenase complex